MELSLTAHKSEPGDTVGTLRRQCRSPPDRDITEGSVPCEGTKAASGAPYRTALDSAEQSGSLALPRKDHLI